MGLPNSRNPQTTTQRNSFASSPCRLSRPPPMVSSVEGGAEQVVKYVEKRAHALNELSDSVSDKLLRLTPTPVQRTTTNERASEVEFQNRGEESRLRPSVRPLVRPSVRTSPIFPSRTRTTTTESWRKEGRGKEGDQGSLKRADGRTDTEGGVAD